MLAQRCWAWIPPKGNLKVVHVWRSKVMVWVEVVEVVGLGSAVLQEEDRDIKVRGFEPKHAQPASAR